MQRETERSLTFSHKARFGLAIDISTTHLAFIRTLRGSTTTFGCFNDVQFDELQVERRLLKSEGYAIAACWYWVRKLQARFFAGDYAAAVAASQSAQQLLWTSPSFLETADAHFYGALSHAASCDATFPDLYRQHVEALTAHHKQLVEWAESCPENFANRASLVAAEIARIEGRELDAERLYEAAIKSARENDFVHNEALANELAARFYAARDLVTISQAYLRNSRLCYLRWGADGKVRQLDQMHSHLRADEPTPGPSSTIVTSVEHLDLATVIKVSQAVSGEMLLPKLVEKLVRIAMEHAGAERCLLVLLRGGVPRIEAEATTGQGRVMVAVPQAIVMSSDLPQSVLHYVIRTQERVLLDDASVDKEYSKDEYVRQKRSRSVMCLPIVKQAKLIGVLYLENTLAPGAFTPDRVTVLQLLASQAAISLENAALYTDLQRSEAFLAHGQRISHTGSFGWSAAGAEFYWSEENYNILEYNRDVQASASLALQRMHPDDHDFVHRLLDDAMRKRKDFDSEHRLLMPDGRVKYVHTSGRAVNTGNLDFVGAVRDITERRRAEEALRQAQSDLARINRVTTMGELAASLAHELSQPISGATTNANTCLRKLGHDNPDLDEVRMVVTRIARDAQRASDIIGRIRAQFKKGALDREAIDVNEINRETVALLRDEAARYNISVRTDLTTDLPQILGDRVQLQQVTMNLIVNSIEAMKDIDGTREIVIKSQWTDDDQILVSISDTGTGFAPELAEQIFDPLFTTKPQGTGMGLRISRAIIEAHGGHLWAAGTLGRGATFHLSLPTARRVL
jgi:PAS domain S-box-containing protein